MLASVLADEHADVLQSRADIPGVVDDLALACARGLMKGEHRIEAGRVEHRMNGPELALAGTSLDKCGADWSGRMAQLLVGCPATREGRTEFTAVSAARPVDEPLTLVSWLLAPRQRQA